MAQAIPLGARTGQRRDGRHRQFYRALIDGFAAFAQGEFELDGVIEGATLREHLTSVWERTGVMPDRLDNPLPDGCENLWHDFLALHNSRGSAGMGGPLRITWADIDAYQRVQGFRLDRWEIEAIRRADGAYMTHYADSRKKPEG